MAALHSCLQGLGDADAEMPALFFMFEENEFRKLMVDPVCKAGFVTVFCCSSKVTPTDLRAAAESMLMHAY